MWLNRFGAIGAIGSRGIKTFLDTAGWGEVSGAASIISLDNVQLNAASSPTGTAGGNLASKIPGNRKIYFELFSVNGLGHAVGHGVHNPISPSAALNSSWIRFYTPNPDPAPGTTETWYLGSNLNTTAYAKASTGWDGAGGLNGNGGPVRTRWAIDTVFGKVWIGMNGTQWLGGGNPATGTTPTFTIDLTDYTIYSQSFYISGGSVSPTYCRIYYDLGNFEWTPPSGFDFNL
jgi:hypothetical protein